MAALISTNEIRYELDKKLHPNELEPFFSLSPQIHPKPNQGLSKPIVDKSGFTILGVENQSTSTSPPSNSLVVGELDLDKIHNKKYYNIEQEGKKYFSEDEPEEPEEFIREKWISYPMKEMVRDICWINEGKALVALDKKLGVIILDEKGLKKIVMFPDFHKDVIRQVSANKFSPYFIISAGFDCSAFITDITRLVEDVQKSEKNLENSVYLCNEVVSSCLWHPNDSNVASATTDKGVLHIFDVRADATNKASIVFDTKKPKLFTHNYLDTYNIVLGYGDGEIQIHDLRKENIVSTFKDPNQKAIGDIVMAKGAEGKIVGLFFGAPSFSVWEFKNGLVSYAGHYFKNEIQKEMEEIPVEDINPMKTSGTFIGEFGSIMTTDSKGMLNFFNLNEKLSAEPF